MSGVAAVAILAGGASRRMGRDKALLTRSGETLLARTARIAGGIAPVVVIGRARPDGWTLPCGFVADDRPGEGPLAAIATALAQVGGDALVVACDLPRLDAAALRWLVAAWAAAPARFGVVTQRDGGLEPLFAVYAPAARAPIDAALARGERSCQRVVSGDGFARAAVPPEHAAALVDCDSPEEWAQLDRERP